MSTELYAYTVISTGDSPTGWAIVRGYASGGHSTRQYAQPETEQAGRELADELNASMGVSQQRALRIIGAGMFPRSVWADEFRETGDVT